MFDSRMTLKLVSILVLGVFLLAVVPGVSMGMLMNADGTMSPCPFMADGGAICPMTLAAHVAGWQQLSTALPVVIAFALLALSLWCSAFFFIHKTSEPLHLRYLRRRDRALRVFAPLFLAFARGIVHSRLFAA